MACFDVGPRQEGLHVAHVLRGTVATSQQAFNITTLPEDILTTIFLNLNARDLNHASQSCKKFYKIVNGEPFLKLLIITNFKIVFSNGNIKREYRLLSSWKEQIFTRHKRIFNANEWGFFTPFQRKPLIVKSDSIETEDGKVKYVLQGKIDLEQLSFTESMFLTSPRKGFISGYDKDFKCLFEVYIPQQKKYNFAYLLNVCEIENHVFFSVFEELYVFDKRTTQLKKVLTLGGKQTIEKMTKLNGQLVIFVHLNMRSESIVFYSLNANLELKENYKNSVKDVTHICTVSQSDKSYLIVVHKTAIGFEIHGHVEDLKKPSIIVSLPQGAADPKIFEKYILFTMKDRTEIWDIFQLEQKMTVDIVLFRCFYNSVSSYGNFLVLANYKQIKIVDMGDLREITTINDKNKIEGVQIVNGELFIYSRDSSSQQTIKQIESFNFGIFDGL